MHSPLKRLEPLLHPRGHGPQVVVHLAGLLAQDEVAHRGAGDLDVLVAAQDVDLRGVSRPLLGGRGRACRTLVSARTMRVLVAFSMANFVLPSLPCFELEACLGHRRVGDVQQYGRWREPDGRPLLNVSETAPRQVN